MKTQKEIDELAKEEYKDYLHNPFFTAAPMGYVKGYTQCQEDMGDVIKKAIEYGYELRSNHKPINSGIDWAKEFNLKNK